MINWLRNKLRRTHRESIDDLDSSVSHSQKGLDTESRAWLLKDFGLIPPFNLNGYLETYLSDDLAQGIVDADSRLTISEFECLSEEDDLCEYITDFNRRIDLFSVVYDAIRDANIFGFAVLEIVGNRSSLLSSDKIRGLKRHDPRFMVIKKDRYGRHEAFIQRPGFAQNARVSVTPPSFERRLDPQTILYIRNTSPFTSYGQSLLQAIETQLQRRSDLLDAAVLAARNHANPTIHAAYTVNENVKETKDEVDGHRGKLKKACESQQEKKSKYIITAGKGEYKFSPIGHNAIPDITELIDHVTASAIISVGLNPASLGFSLGKSGVTSFEASDKMLVNAIIQKQRAIVAQLQSKLYSLLPLIESETPKGEIIVQMKPPTAESLKDSYEADSILINNVERRVRNGSLTGDGMARLLGEKELQDKEQFEEWKNSTETEEPNPNDPNVNQSVDKAVRSLSNGKSPSNNPSGRKGESNNGNQIREIGVGRFGTNQSPDA